MPPCHSRARVGLAGRTKVIELLSLSTSLAVLCLRRLFWLAHAAPFHGGEADTLMSVVGPSESVPNFGLVSSLGMAQLGRLSAGNYANADTRTRAGHVGWHRASSKRQPRRNSKTFKAFRNRTESKKWLASVRPTSPFKERAVRNLRSFAAKNGLKRA